MKNNCKFAKCLQAIWKSWICPADFLERIRTLLVLFVIDFTVAVEEMRVPRATRSKSELEALARQVVEHFERYAKLTNRISPDASLSVSAIDDFSRLPDVVASNMNTSVEVKQTILAEPSPKRRLEKLLDLLVKEIEILLINQGIDYRTPPSRGANGPDEVVIDTAAGNVRLFSAGAPSPVVSSLNYSAGQTRANNAIAPLSAAGQMSVRCAPSGTAHVIVDVNGYFQ